MDPPAAVSEETNGNGTADQVDGVNFKSSDILPESSFLTINGLMCGNTSNLQETWAKRNLAVLLTSP